MYTLSESFTHAEEIKRSRFIATALPVASPEEALARLEMTRDPEANHNCFAYRIGDQYRFSDDGEPGGTAGRPILSAIEGQEFDLILVIVTRFFGGTKLGAGGLVRAYGGTAAKCLAAAPRVEIRRKTTVSIEAPFDAIGAIYAIFDQFSALKMGEEYGEAGIVLTLEIEENRLAEFETALRDATRGRAAISLLTPSTHREKSGS